MEERISWYVNGSYCAYSHDNQLLFKADILPGLGAKQPKTVAGCVYALKEVIR
jgi:hypothetical protein